MSHTPVREALMRLAEEGLVENLPNNGFLVVVTTLKEIEEIFDLRPCLEKYLIEEVFDKDITLNLSNMTDLVKLQSSALDKNDF